MILSGRRRGIAAIAPLALCAGLLGASDDSGTAMYLRVPSMQSAPPVLSVSYSATAAVPRRKMKPSLVPPESVTGTILLPADTTTAAPTLGDFRGVTTFTVVQIGAGGSVVMRTRFTGVSVQSIGLAAAPSGGTVRRLRFLASTVEVTRPSH